MNAPASPASTDAPTPMTPSPIERVVERLDPVLHEGERRRRRSRFGEDAAAATSFDVVEGRAALDELGDLRSTSWRDLLDDDRHQHQHDAGEHREHAQDRDEHGGPARQLAPLEPSDDRVEAEATGRARCPRRAGSSRAVWMLPMSRRPSPTPSVATNATRNGLCTFIVASCLSRRRPIAVTSGYAQDAPSAGIGPSRATFRWVSLV